MWTTVREKVRQRSRTTEVMLAGAIVRAVDGDTLVLSHESAPLAKRLVEQRNSDVIREALKDALGVDWKIRCERAPRHRRRHPYRRASLPSPPQRDDEEEHAGRGRQRHLRSPAPRPGGSRDGAAADELGARRIDE